MPSLRSLTALLCVVLSVSFCMAKPGPETRTWEQTAAIKSNQATQAAAADEKFLYAISNTEVAKYDRQTNQLVATSTGAAEHLNSAVWHDGKLYCAHSNYPKQPEQSEIKVLDLNTMQLTIAHQFGASEGSLTWAVPVAEHWYCNFAYYGKENHRSYVAHFDRDWKELARWSYPEKLLSQLGEHSLSGGIWQAGEFLVSGHDDPVLFRLKIPATGNKELLYLGSETAPLTGQGFAHDPVTGGLIGIHRPRREILLMELSKPR